MFSDWQERLVLGVGAGCLLALWLIDNWDLVAGSYACF